MIIQYVIVILMGSWSLYYIIKKFIVKNKPTSNKSCGKGCGC